jgi:urea transport system ATP-binding protein
MDSSGAHVKDDLIDTRHGCILYIEEVTVSFDGFKALNDLNLFVDDGELLCIIGPNGAGKTTMMDVITGKTRPDKGAVFFGQNLDLTQMTEFEISHAGIGRKFQKPTVFLNHTVFENLELALHTNKGIWQSLTKPLNGEQQETIEEDLETIGLKDQKDLRAGLLSHGQKQWLEIGMLLAQDPRLLLIDEPVAGMTHQETEHTAELLKSLAGKHSVVVVEHEMDFIRSLANRVVVLHEGHVLAEGKMEEVQNNPKVIEVYLGS